MKRRKAWSVLAKRVPCALCGQTSRKVFAVGSRFICDRDACLDQELHALGIPRAQWQTVKAKLRKEFDR